MTHLSVNTEHTLKKSKDVLGAALVAGDIINMYTYRTKSEEQFEIYPIDCVAFKFVAVSKKLQMSFPMYSNVTYTKVIQYEKVEVFLPNLQTGDLVYLIERDVLESCDPDISVMPAGSVYTYLYTIKNTDTGTEVYNFRDMSSGALVGFFEEEIGRMYAAHYDSIECSVTYVTKN